MQKAALFWRIFLDKIETIAYTMYYRKARERKQYYILGFIFLCEIDIALSRISEILPLGYVFTFFLKTICLRHKFQKRERERERFIQKKNYRNH